MPAPPAYPDLLRALALGTARRDLDPAVGQWLDSRDAIDPTADQSEYLLAAVGLAERLYRRHTMRVHTPSDTKGNTAPEETRPAPGPRLTRGLQLILEGTYPGLLDEAVEIVIRRGTRIPFFLLPAFHLRAAALLNEDYPRALRYLKASGERGHWLARQHPDWAALTSDYDYVAAYRSEELPAAKAQLLGRWRRRDPPAARHALQKDWPQQSPRNQEVLLQGLKTGLGPDDWPWLREALGPKRKGVRRALTEVLLLAREPEVMADFTVLARAVVSTAGGFSSTLQHPELKEKLATYGGVKAPQTLPQRLLEILPPEVWAEVTGLDLPTFWRSRKPLELRNAARAIEAYRDPEQATAFVRFLLFEQPAQFDPALGGELVRLLSTPTFDALYDELLSGQPNVLLLRSLPRLLALQRDTPWSERLSRAMMNQLVDGLSDRQLDYGLQRELAGQWKRAIPLLHVELFPWLRQQLHATTERYDAFGKLATELLQTTAFRRELHRP